MAPGNWTVSGLYQQGHAYVRFTFGGSLLNEGGAVSGIVHANDPCFGSGAIDIPFTGSVAGDNRVSVSSAPVNGESLAFGGKLASDGASLTGATFTVTGRCTGNLVSVDAPNGPGAFIHTSAFQINPLDGTWSSVSSSPAPSYTEQLSQSATADAHGHFDLSGTVAVQGSPCFRVGTLQAGSYVSGTLGQQRILFDDGSTLEATVTLTGEAGSKPAITLSPAILSGGQCDGSLIIGLQ